MKALMFIFLFCQVSNAQTFCDKDQFESLDSINFNKITFIKQDIQIDSVKYTYSFSCPLTNAKIYCNIDKHGKLNGPAIIFAVDGTFFARGEFTSNKKHGWWWYGRDKVLYKRNKQKKVRAFF